MRLGWWGVCASALLSLAACGSGAPTEPSGQFAGEVVVFAASSLTNTFTLMAEAFEDEYPGADVQLNLAGSSTLREQILAGAPADVFASANEENMERVDEGGELGSDPATFATNTLSLAVPAGNPGGVSGVEDLGNSSLLVGLCNESVPCGQFAEQMLATAGVEASVDTNEADVRALLTKIGADELDVGVVYVTDIEATAGVDGIEIPADVNVVATYPIATLTAAQNQELAELFVDFVLSTEGQGIMTAAGFGPP